MLKKLVKILAIIICLLPALILLLSPLKAQAQTEPVINLQLQELQWEAKWQVLIGEPPLLPLRQIGQEMGASVQWHQESGLIFYFAGRMAAAFHPKLEYIYFFEENNTDLTEADLTQTDSIKTDLMETDLMETENQPEQPDIIFTKTKGVNPLIIKNKTSYITGDNLVFLGMEGFWDENYSYLDIILNPEIYGQECAALASADMLYQLIKDDLEEELSNIPQLLGSYKSNFNPADKNRTVNLKLSAAALNGVEIAPGGSFSFNNTVGARTPQRGYLKAIIFSYGEKELGYGGGVCQVSSTLYNGVLEAKLQVLERHPHSRAVDYIPLGRDATVAYGYKDFRFKNNTERYIVIRCKVNANSLEVELWQVTQIDKAAFFC